MNNLIPVINRLQDVFAAIGQQTLDLPQIVVVGSQSSGKSSVLENIVGRDFLPRGSGIVTRRPLILQLYTLPPDSNFAQGNEWGEFLHLPGQKFYDFSEICNEIERETIRVTGRNKGISDKTINLRIYSPFVLNLTLVDLPGITRVPTGDQPEDIEDQIRNMCVDFISNPNAVILAVTSANQDVSNSDGLKLARDCDPEGVRTIGVLTKVDIMDAGTDAADILCGRGPVRLRKGYVAVINRSQKDIQDKVSIREGLAKEKKFFDNHPKYRTMINKCGTENLAKTLNSILMQHIRDCLPEIKSKIGTMLQDVQGILDLLGEDADSANSTAAKKGQVLLGALSRFSSTVTNFIDGRDNNEGINTTMLYGGARIAYIFNEVFAKRLRSVDPFTNLTDDDIRTAMANANGVRQVFFADLSFELLVRKQISRLELPGLQCVDLIYDEMLAMCCRVDDQDFSRFPILRDRVFEIVNNLLRSCVKPTQAMISNLIKVELAHINTAHPDFIGVRKAMTLQNPHRNAASASNKAPPAGNNNDPSNVLNSSVSMNNNASTGAADNNSDVNNAAVSTGNKQQFQNVTTQRGSSTGTRAAANSSEVQQPPTNIAPPQTSAPSGGFFNLFRPASVEQSNSTGSGQIAGPVSPSRNNNIKSTFNAEAGAIKLSQVSNNMRAPKITTEYERVETDTIKLLISSYFEIVKKNFIDLVPKTIMHFLVTTFKETLQNALVSELYREMLFPELLRETDEIAVRRQQNVEMRELLLKAMEIVNEVRDYNAFNS